MHLSAPAQIFGVDGVIILIVVALVLFGSTQIPKLAHSLGSAQKEFKKGISEGAPEEAAGPTSAVQAPSTAAVDAPGRTTVTGDVSGSGTSHITP